MISSDVRRAGPYAGTGITASYAFAFKVFDPTEVVIVLKDIDGVEDDSPVGWTVTINADQNVSPGGTVVGVAALGETVTITSDVAETQSLQITNNGAFYPRVLNDAHDKLTILVQQLRERLDRTFVVPISDDISDYNLTLPQLVDRKGMILGFDTETGGLIVTADYAALLAASAAAVTAAAQAIAAAQVATAIANDLLPIQDVDADYTVTTTDLGKRLRVISDDDTNIYVPDALVAAPSIGFQCQVQQYGAGTVYIIPFAEATVNAIGAANAISAQYGVARLVVDSATTVNLDGDLSGSGGVGWIVAAEDFGPFIDLTIDVKRAGGALDPTKLTINVTEPSWNLATGASGTNITRALACTKWARMRAPDYLDPYEVVDGAMEYVRVWKESWTYNESTALTIDAAKGWWTWNSISAPADTAIVVTKSSPVASPAPYGNWISPNRQFVGDSLVVECAAFHRNARLGRMVAGVLFTVTDSLGATLTQWVNATVISGRACDLKPVVSYKHTFDVSTLATGFLKVDALVKPFIGAATYNTASVAQNTRFWCTQVHYRDATRLAAPYVVYVNSTTGNDTTGVASTTDATAAASPCLTIGGALVKLDAAQGYIDGGIIYLKAGTHSLGLSATAVRQKAGWVTIRPAGDTNKAGVTLNLTASTFRPRITSGFVGGVATGAVRLYDLKVNRTGIGQMAGETGFNCLYIWDLCDINNMSVTSAYLSASGYDMAYGLTITNPAGNFMSVVTAGNHWLWRGLSVTGVNVEMFILVGSDLSGCTLTTTAAVNYDGGFVYCNQILNAPNGMISIASPSANRDVNGYAVVQNLFEYIGTSITLPMIGVTRDSATGDTTHIIFALNTMTGAMNAGRGNFFYDDGATHRVSTLAMVKGNLWGGTIATKGDIFRFLNDGVIDNPYHDGNWEYINGVDCEAEVTPYLDGSTTGFQAAREFPGINAVVGTSTTVRLDILFTDYKGSEIVAGVVTAGAGGGTYTLEAGSPARSKLRLGILSHTLDSVVRPATNDNAGAFSAV